MRLIEEDRVAREYDDSYTQMMVHTLRIVDFPESPDPNNKTCVQKFKGTRLIDTFITLTFT
jgi:hypothetical protein